MYSHSISGIRSSVALMEKAAVEVGKGPQADILQSQVDMMVAKNSAGANLAVLKAANELHKTIIDLIA
ncbi:MAG: hypothetical protein GY839_03470 [candidate division Zixibacteria bacterium]|nr:hypothetical protein [candidate division Zixibacteria bacterium]